ncbi:hypothetical protein CBL_09322 [Carabus blaptoides fortunei]
MAQQSASRVNTHGRGISHWGFGPRRPALSASARTHHNTWTIEASKSTRSKLKPSLHSDTGVCSIIPPAVGIEFTLPSASSVAPRSVRCTLTHSVLRGTDKNTRACMTYPRINIITVHGVMYSPVREQDRLQTDSNTESAEYVEEKEASTRGPRT